MLLRVHWIPEQMGSSLAYFFSNAIPYFMILYGASNLFWQAALWKENEVGVVSIFTTVLYLLLPLRTLLDRLSKPLNILAWIYYWKYRLGFTSDYNRQNPITK